MKIHSDTLTMQDILACIPDTCYPAVFDYKNGRGIHTGYVHCVGSRKRNQGFIIRLSGSGKTCMWHLRDKAATYDEWGYFLAALFQNDSEAICGPYADEHDFHEKTEYKYHRTCRSCDKPIDNNLGYCGAPLCMGEADRQRVA